ARPRAGDRRARAGLGARSVGAQGLNHIAQTPTGLGEAVLDSRRARVEDLALEDACVLQLGQPCCERARGNALERLLELVEADGARLGRGPEDGERPAPSEEVCRAGDLLGQRLAGPTAHAGSASPWARGP